MASRILLTTSVEWPSSARLAGAFAGCGAVVEALFPPGHVLAQSRFVSAAHRYSAAFPLVSLGRAIKTAMPDLIVPCDDRAVGQLLRLHARNPSGPAAGVIARSLGAVGNYPTLVNRPAFIDAARAAGLEAPQAIAVRNGYALDLAIAALGLPVVIKSDGSWGGEGVVIARSAEQAHDAFRRLSAVPTRLRSLARVLLRRDLHFLRDIAVPPRPSISVQSFVTGTPATSAFACWEGRVLASIHMDVLASNGATGPASVMRRVDCPHMEHAAQTLAARFRLSGLHGLDFIRDASGRPHLIEINPRATQACALALGPGHDLPAALAAQVSPSLYGARPAATANDVIALFPQEWRRDPQSAWLKTAHLDVPWDDPALLVACLAPGTPLPQRHDARSRPLGAPQVLTSD